MRLYPLFADLKDRRVLVVGGGHVAERKIRMLLDSAAAVEVVAERLSPWLREQARDGRVSHRALTFCPQQLDGAWLVIAATDDADVNIGVFDDAEERAMLVNVVDVPPLCNFILPAIVRSGPLAIAISTAGASPALAKRMKAEIADHYGEDHARLAVILNETRGWAKSTLPTYQDRKAFFEGIVNGDPDPVVLIREDREPELFKLIENAKREAEASLAA